MIDAEGHKATFEKALTEAMQNAAEDFKNFSLAHEQLDNVCDVSMHDFIGTALTQVKPWIDFREVKAVAERLLLQGELDAKQIEELIPYPAEDEAQEALSKIFPKNC